MGGFSDIARHFGLKAVYVLAAWGVTRVLDAGRKRLLRRGMRTTASPSDREPEEAAARATPKTTARYKVYHNPANFKPSNPGWLREAASLDPADLATDLSWQCPLLIEFQAAVAARSCPGQQLHPQPQRAQKPSARGSGGSTVGGAAGSLSVAGFGRQAREELFVLRTGVTYLNHGSYGAAFRLALEVQAWYQQLLEAQPVRFMETVALKGLVAATADAARFVGASPRDVVPVTNATSAVNAVLSSVPLRRGDWVLMLNTTYPAVKSTIARVAAAAGAIILEVQLGLEEMLRPSLAVGAVQAALGAMGGRRRVRLAVVDHVVSFPPVVMPVAELVGLCKQVGAQVLVDGAHAIGNVPGLQIPALGADYYTTNLHKWGCSPKGAALLWAAPERQPALTPVITSHGYRLGFRGEFLWQGTADPSAWLAVPAALAVLRALGPERVARHNACLVSEAAALLRRRWEGSAPGPTGPGVAAEGLEGRRQQGSSGNLGKEAGGRGTQGGGGRGEEEGAVGGVKRTGAAGGSGADVAEGADTGAAFSELVVLGGGGDWEGGGAAGMLAVQLPRLREYGSTPEDAVRLQRWLRNEKDIEVPVVAALDRLWVRISAQVYNDLADYEQLATAIAALRP